MSAVLEGRDGSPEGSFVSPYEPRVRERRFALTQRQADALTAVSNVIFAVALLPTVLENQPPTPLTSAATIVALIMLQIVMFHFKLWWGCVWNLVCTGMWVALLIQGLS